MRADRADVRDVLLVHRALRTEFGRAADLVRSVLAGDVARAAEVADHVEMMQRFLHVHDRWEDTLLWPRLEQRVSPEAAAMVEVMTLQHVEMEALIAKSFRRLEVWRRSAGKQDRENLAVALSELYVRLRTHLDIEESEVLPLVEQHITESEWHQFGGHVLRALPFAKLLVVVGMCIGFTTSAEVVRKMLAGLPMEQRVLLSLFAPHACAAYMRRVYRGATAAEERREKDLSSGGQIHGATGGREARPVEPS